MTRYLPSSAPAVLLLVVVLFLSAAGGAVAGGKITGAQIKNGTITSKDVKDGTLATKDLSPAAVTALTYKLPHVVASSAPQPVPSSSIATVQAQCPTGTVVIGGGVVFELPADGTLLDSGPLSAGDVGWFVDVQNTGGQTQLVTAQAHCANLG